MSDPSIRYRIKHVTHYRYSEAVAICQNQLRMQPRTRPGMNCIDSKIEITPEPDTVTEHHDYYGNRVYSFAIESLHKELTASASSEVIVYPHVLPARASVDSWQSVLAEKGKIDLVTERVVDEFVFDSPRIVADRLFAEYALESFTEEQSIADAVLDLTKRIHRDFRYDTSATHVNTPTIDAFKLRAGVCQDFAHIQIACLRSIGLPARYVSGYLRTIPAEGKPRAIGADESHAWLSVYAGQQSGWIDCDPTNACLCGTDHIPICIGRDYSDVSPMRGVILGGGRTSLKVSVDVRPILADENESPTAAAEQIKP